MKIKASPATELFDASHDPTVIEYAAQTVVKGKSPAFAAADTAKKLSGGHNMFIKTDGKPYHIDPVKLEDALWQRYADMARKAMTKYNRTAEDAARGVIQTIWGLSKFEQNEKKYLKPLVKAIQKPKSHVHASTLDKAGPMKLDEALNVLGIKPGETLTLPVVHNAYELTKRKQGINIKITPIIGKRIEEAYKTAMKEVKMVKTQKTGPIASVVKASPATDPNEMQHLVHGLKIGDIVEIKVKIGTSPVKTLKLMVNNVQTSGIATNVYFQFKARPLQRGGPVLTAYKSHNTVTFQATMNQQALPVLSLQKEGHGQVEDEVTMKPAMASVVKAATPDEKKFNDLARQNVVGREGSMVTERKGNQKITKILDKNDRTKVIAERIDTLKGAYIVKSEYKFHLHEKVSPKPVDFGASVVKAAEESPEAHLKRTGRCLPGLHQDANGKCGKAMAKDAKGTQLNVGDKVKQNLAHPGYGSKAKERAPMSGQVTDMKLTKSKDTGKFYHRPIVKWEGGGHHDTHGSMIHKHEEDVHGSVSASLDLAIAQLPAAVSDTVRLDLEKAARLVASPADGIFEIRGLLDKPLIIKGQEKLITTLYHYRVKQDGIYTNKAQPELYGKPVFRGYDGPYLDKGHVCYDIIV